MQLSFFHFTNDVLNFHSHFHVFKVFFKTRPILIFFPVHFQSNNLFAFIFASLVHSYSYLSKIIFSKSTLNLKTVSFIKNFKPYRDQSFILILFIFTLTFCSLSVDFYFPLSLEAFFHTSSSQTRVTSVKSYTFRNFLNHITFPFTWSLLSHFIFPDQGHISKILHLPRFPKSYHIPPELKIVLFTSWNIVVRYLGSEWPWSNRCPILLGCHLIYRNIKSIIMFHLLWNIYLCFDQITKNIYMVIHISINHWLIDIWITKTHIYVGGKREEEKLSMLPEDIDNFSPSRFPPTYVGFGNSYINQ